MTIINRQKDLLSNVKKVLMGGSLSFAVLFLPACGGSSNNGTASSTPASQATSVPVSSEAVSLQTNSSEASSSGNSSQSTSSASSASGSIGFGLATRPSNITCLAPAALNTTGTSVISWPIAF